MRSLWTKAAEEKNIPRPSKELMNCKQKTINLIITVSSSFQVTDTYIILTTPLVLIYVSYTEHFTKLIKTKTEPLPNAQVFTELN